MLIEFFIFKYFSYTTTMSMEDNDQPQVQAERHMTAAERRRQKILARGTSRIDQITGSFQKTAGAVYRVIVSLFWSHDTCTLAETTSVSLVEDTDKKIVGDSMTESLPSDEPVIDASLSSASPKLPPRRAKVSISRGDVQGTTRLDQKRKVGTLADAKWNHYSVSAKGQMKRKVSSNIQIATLTRVERMRAVVPLSKGPRLALVALVALIICMLKEGEQTKLPDHNIMLDSRQQMLGVCSNMVMGGFKALTVNNLVRCMSKSRFYYVLRIQNSVASLDQNGFMAYVLYKKPMLLVFAASLGTMLVVFVSSCILPQILAGSVDNTKSNHKDNELFQRAIKMLPPKIVAVYRGLDVLKLVMNTIFLDAGFYIVILVTYQLLPLAYGSN